MDGYHAQMASGRVGELGFSADIVLPDRPSEYFARNVWIGASFPSPSEADAMKKVGIERMMWGSDYPHNESTFPYNRDHLRRSFSGWDEADLRKVFAENAAEVYRIDLDALAPLPSASALRSTRWLRHWMRSRRTPSARPSPGPEPGTSHVAVRLRHWLPVYSVMPKRSRPNALMALPRISL